MGDSMLGKPLGDSINGLVGGLKEVYYFIRSPMLAKMRGCRIGDSHEVLMRLIQVGLSEPDTHRQLAMLFNPRAFGPS